ncbi:hypothetical protein D5086_032992 [Populus alba]|uniref:Uncharacterized protein n=1 Tax=Populus alba TaxID=43335 RepID=A0ACC4AFK4_POPAL
MKRSTLQSEASSFQPLQSENTEFSNPMIGTYQEAPSFPALLLSSPQDFARSPITMRPHFIFFLFGSPITMRPHFTFFLSG